MPHLEGLPMFLLVKCQLLLLMGLLQVTANHVIGIIEVLMGLFHKLWWFHYLTPSTSFNGAALT